MNLVQRLLLGISLVAMASVAGCEKKDPSLVTVTGTVTVGSTPLANASVTFIPKDGTPGFGGVGKTDANGKYTLVGSRDNAKGIMPGEYRVVISKRLMPDGSELPPNDNTPPIMSPAKESLAPAYSSMTSTSLTATVSASGGSVDFVLPETKKK
jgi:hypothetical protein